MTLTHLDKQRVITGIKPTGTPHLGNMVGAIAPIIDMARVAKETFVFIADLHALNSSRDSQKLATHTREIAASFIALGLDTERATFFKQSDILEVAVLSSLLTNVTPKGLMNRSHAYKARVQENTTEGRDVDDGVNMGLFNYPILMAADILLYNADIVPIGADQKQHVEIARDIAGSFNALYGGTILTPPAPVIEEDKGAIPGLDGRKMSKSYDNIIPIFSTSKELRKAVMAIKTDSRLPEEPKNPDDSIIYQIYKAFATPAQREEMRGNFEKGGMGYGTAKQMLFELLDIHLTPARERYNELMANDEVERILAAGAEKARIPAKQQLTRVMQAMLGQ